MLGDLAAQVAACHIGDRALQELAERYGPERLAALMDGLLDHTERCCAARSRAGPTGRRASSTTSTRTASTCATSRSTVDLTIRGDEVIADFSRSAPMVRGALNSTPSFAEASVYQTVMAASAIEIPRTGGAIRPITVITKPGTVMHVLMPGASSMRGDHRLPPLRRDERRARAARARPRAGGGRGRPHARVLRRRRSRGERRRARVVYSELVVGTWGGRPVVRRQRRPREPVRDAWRTSRSRWPRPSGRSWSSATGSSPTPAARAASAAGSRSSACGGASRPTRRVHVRSDRQVHRPYGLDGGRRGRGLVER